jgi:hypothetical protein
MVMNESKHVKGRCVVCKKFFAPRNGLQRRCTACQKRGLSRGLPDGRSSVTDINALIQQDLEAEVNQIRAELDDLEENSK